MLISFLGPRIVTSVTMSVTSTMLYLLSFCREAGEPELYQIVTTHILHGPMRSQRDQSPPKSRQLSIMSTPHG